MALVIKETELSPQFTSEQRKILRKLAQEIYDQALADFNIGLNDLNDVTITSPADKDTLRYNNSNQQWENQDYKHSFIVCASNQLGTFGALTRAAVFRMPFAFTVSSVKASLETAQTSGNLVTVDINKNGSSILSTLITIDNGEKTSTTAVTQPVLSVTSFAADDEVSIDIDQIGDSTAVGLVVTIIGDPA